jgi:hypothetical protein
MAAGTAAGAGGGKHFMGAGGRVQVRAQASAAHDNGVYVRGLPGGRRPAVVGVERPCRHLATHRVSGSARAVWWPNGDERVLLRHGCRRATITSTGQLCPMVGLSWLRFTAILLDVWHAQLMMGGWAAGGAVAGHVQVSAHMDITERARLFGLIEA